jgi:hypothetical protein
VIASIQLVAWVSIFRCKLHLAFFASGKVQTAAVQHGVPMYSSFHVLQKAIIEAMEGVLASVERERTDLFAMAKAAAMELAHEMKKVREIGGGSKMHVITLTFCDPCEVICGKRVNLDQRMKPRSWCPKV